VSLSVTLEPAPDVNAGVTLRAPRIAGVSYAVPPAVSQRALWSTLASDLYRGNRVAEKIWQNSGVEQRHLAIDPRRERALEWGTEQRMQRFLPEATPLGRAAIERALETAGVPAAEVGLLAVVTSTGYVAPGLDSVLVKEVGMAATTERLHIGHMGCYAALPGLAAVSDFVTARNRPAVLLCVELSSLHARPVGDTMTATRQSKTDIMQVVGHSLFGDAASATVVVPGTSFGWDTAPAGFEVQDFLALTDPNSREALTWTIGDQGFMMQLSPTVPTVIGHHVREFVAELLGRNGLGVEDVAGWAVHPGGPRILEVVQEELQLPSWAMAPSYGVLRDFGNCESATVPLILGRLFADRTISEDEPVVALAFGPGLTLYAALLRRRR